MKLVLRAVNKSLGLCAPTSAFACVSSCYKSRPELVTAMSSILKRCESVVAAESHDTWDYFGDFFLARYPLSLRYIILIWRQTQVKSHHALMNRPPT